LVTPSISRATPIQYDFTSGYVTLWATVGSSVLISPNTAPLNGIQVTLDTYSSSPQLVDMQLTAPGPIALGFDQNYSGYNHLVIDSLSISGGPGSLVLVGAGPPDEYFYIVSPLTLALGISANGPAPSQGPISGMLVSTSSAATGTIFLDPFLNELTLTGITLGSFDLGTGGAPIVLKGDFVYTGVPIPEPSTAVGLATVIATFAGARTRMRRRRT
jgi:hypothetical protein